MTTPARSNPARLPWGTAAAVLTMLALAAAPRANLMLELRRDAVAAGEWWRFVTCQLVHPSLRTMALDVGAVLVLGALLERTRRSALVLTLCGSLLLVPAAFWITRPDLERFQGSSGIASAILIALCLLVLGGQRRLPRLAALAALALFVSKTALEFSGRLPGGLARLPTDFEVVPEAHAAGAAAGALAALVTLRRSRLDPDPERRQS